KEVCDLRNLLHFATRLLDTLRHVVLGAEAVPVCFLEFAHDAFFKTGTLQADRVEPVQPEWIAHGAHKWRHILRYSRCTADERIATNAHKLVHSTQSRDGRAFFDRDMPGQLRPIRHDDAVAKLAIVRKMHVTHDETAATNTRRDR